jgi:putative flippase GtrA
VKAEKLRQFVLYTSVNVAASCVDFVCFLTLTHLYGLPALQSVIAYSISILVNFQLQRRFVFANSVSQKSEWRLFTDFVATGMFGLASTVLVIWFTIHVLDLAPAVAKTIAMLVCFVVLYVARSRFVFNATTAQPLEMPSETA